MNRKFFTDLGYRGGRIPFKRLFGAALSLGLCLQNPSPGQEAAKPETPATPATPASQPVQPPPLRADGLPSSLEYLQNAATTPILPNMPVKADLELTSGRTSSWLKDGVFQLLLEQDVKVAVGAYGFSCEKAAVLVTPQPSRGPDVYEVAMFLQNVKEMEGRGGVSQEAPRLLVTVIIDGRVDLNTNLMREQVVEQDPLMMAAVERIARHREMLAKNTVALPAGDPLASPAETALRQEMRKKLGVDDYSTPVVVIDPKTGQAKTIDSKPVVKPKVPLIQQVTGRVAFHADKVVYKSNIRPGKPADAKPAQAPGTTGPATATTSATPATPPASPASADEGAILLIGTIQVLYDDPSTKRQLTLTADNAVIIVAGDVAQALSGGKVDASSVRGVYLEDNVTVTDGQYTMRGPRVFVDLVTNRAILLEAVFYTWDPRQQAPIYVRADQLRQVALNQWSANDAKLTNSEFAEPHFAIGAGSLTVTREPGATEADDRYSFEAKNIGVQVGGANVFMWPHATGAGAAIASPVRRLGFGTSEREGFIARTEWDLFSLLGTQGPKGMDLSLLVDGYTKRGPGVGINSDYKTDDNFGMFEGYYMFDQGEDEPGGRQEVVPEDEHRGKALWRHRQLLEDNWQVSAELGWVSDPTFLEEFFRNEAYADKPYETSLYVKKQEDDWAFTFLAKYDLLDFVPQWTELQTAGNIGLPGGAASGYNVDKLPEVTFEKIGTSLFDNRATWYSENRVSAMRLRLPEVRPVDLGFNPAESLAVFGMANGARIDAAQRAAGLDEQTRLRLDTRQEIQLPTKMGIFNVTPYVVGRVTGYDDDFAEYSGGAEDDAVRFWGGVGVRASTTFSRSFDDVNNAVLDLHRMRHIIEPNVNLFVSETTIQQEHLPVYDYDVESLSDGAQVRLGLRNTLQTQRGGDGFWRSVDFLTVDTDFIIASDDNIPESPVARFFDYRPELSLAGNHFWGEAKWLISDTVTFAGNVNHSFDSDEIEQWNLGLSLNHSPDLTTFYMLRRIDEIDSYLFRYGFDYRISPTYHMGFAHSYDIHEHSSRNLSISLTRRLPRWLLMVVVNFDTVGEETSVGVALSPEGAGGRASPDRNPFLYKP